MIRVFNIYVWYKVKIVSSRLSGDYHRPHKGTTTSFISEACTACPVCALEFTPVSIGFASLNLQIYLCSVLLTIVHILDLLTNEVSFLQFTLLVTHLEVMGVVFTATVNNQFSYIMAVSFNGSENQSTQGKPQTFSGSLSNSITGISNFSGDRHRLHM